MTSPPLPEPDIIVISIPIPLAGYDDFKRVIDVIAAISIPIPLAGYDKKIVVLYSESEISIPIPLAGYDVKQTKSNHGQVYFNPHTPRGV